MTQVPIWHGHIDDDGRFGLAEPEREQRRVYFRTLAGQNVEITVRKERTQRSLDQNAYWWAVPVRLLAEHCGYTDPQMHYALLGECFGYIVGPTGKEIPNVPSSSQLTTDQFTHLIDWVLIWGPTEMQVDIPPPDKVSA